MGEQSKYIIKDIIEFINFHIHEAKLELESAQTSGETDYYSGGIDALIGLKNYIEDTYETKN